MGTALWDGLRDSDVNPPPPLVFVSCGSVGTAPFRCVVSGREVSLSAGIILVK